MKTKENSPETSRMQSEEGCEEEWKRQAFQVRWVYNTGENLGDLGFGDEFLGITRKAGSWKHRYISRTSLKLKTYTLQKTLLGEWKDKHRLGENICKTYIW